MKTYIFLGLVMLSLLITRFGGGFGSEDKPSCSEVWVVGKTLPSKYRGCESEEGVTQPSMAHGCTDGSTIDAYEKFWAFHGGTVRKAIADGGTSANNGFAVDLANCDASR